MKTLNDDAAIEAIIAMLMDLQERENVNLPLYEQQLRDVERNIENLLDAIQQGIFTKSTKARPDELEATKEDLEIRIANEKLAKPKLTGEKIKHFLYRFRTLDMTKKKHRQLPLAQVAASAPGSAPFAPPSGVPPPSGRLRSLSQPVRLTAPFTQGSLCCSAIYALICVVRHIF